MEKESDGTLEEKSKEKIWTDNIERVLDHLRLNCAQLSNYHRYKYIYYKHQVKWFKIPIILLSGVNTFIAVGMQSVLGQYYVSIITSIISLFTGIITGIEMFMKFQDKMVTELNTHRDYYKISIEIYKVISIDRKSREISGTTFLDAKFSEYEKIKSRSNPEQHFNLVHDILADEEDLIIFKRENTKAHKKGWVNKIELAPPLHDKDRINYDINLGYDKYRDPLKWLLRERTKKIEGKRKMTQKYLDQKWIERNKQETRKEEQERTKKREEGERVSYTRYNEKERSSSPRRRSIIMEPLEEKDEENDEEKEEEKEENRLNKKNLLRMASQAFDRNDVGEDEFDEKRDEDSEINEDQDNAISIKVNEKRDIDCESDYACPLSDKQYNFSIMNFLMPRRNSLYYESDSSDETEQV